MNYRNASLACVGPGAIGLFYCARLASRHPALGVSLLARNDLEALKRKGIQVRERGGLLTIAPERLQLASQAEELGPVDLVLVTLKTTANAHFASLLGPLLGPKTSILTLQNGLGSDRDLAIQFGAERVLGGLAFIACNRTASAEVTCFHPGSLSLGSFRSAEDPRCSALATLFEEAGIPCEVVKNLQEARWRKLIWNVPFNGLSIAAGGLTTDLLLADATLAGEVRELMEEVARAATAMGYTIPPAFLEAQLAITPSLGAYHPSSLLDWKAGKAVEVEAIWGEALRQAQAQGVNTPRLALLYALLTRLCRCEPPA